ncbi:zinc finger and BTB domain-containing protein 41-like isoform X25 [Euwallacea similis]|uniref:zinc finger and BTB domain-containing protein 41-like isoform X25 n=1 Tax=Euwallacea similis TaxID=1736056 RepID=UPI00344D1FA0
MDNPGEILRLCRLCLVKDQVNIPIFEEQGDIRQTFLKIRSCLPVKVSRDDKLPKKICGGCSNKLDLFYEFWSSTANSEKTLQSWLGQEEEDDKMQEITKPVEALVKEESEALEDGHAHDQSFDEATKDEAEAPPAKRARRTAAVKAQINISHDSDEDEDVDGAEPITKIEDESDDSDGEEKDPSYTEVPGTSADDQAGPSGLGKDGVEAPCAELDQEDLVSIKIDDETIDDNNTISINIDDGFIDNPPIEQYQCGICCTIFSSKTDFIEKHLNVFAKKLTCCKCNQSFNTSDDMYDHHEVHKEDESYGAMFQDQNSEGEELIVMKEGQHLVEVRQPDGTDMVYILDEIIMGEDELLQGEESKKSVVKKPLKPEQLVNFDHGYVLSEVVSSNAISLNSVPTTKRAYTPPKSRITPLKKRHEVPDFSITEFIEMEPSEEFDALHYKCQRCEQLFINTFGFYRHFEKGKCYVNGCDICGSSFTSNSDFYAHYVAEHPDRAICNFCFRTFMYEKNVKEHMLRHLDQFRHRCEQCSKGFYTVREYRNHYKNRHMGIRHTCEVCGRSFADEYYFRKHIDTHKKVSNRNAVVAEVVDEAVE